MNVFYRKSSQQCPDWNQSTKASNNQGIMARRIRVEKEIKANISHQGTRGDEQQNPKAENKRS